MKPVGIDFFTRVIFPGGLKSNGAGLAAFATKRANPREDRNETALWLLQGGSPRQLTDYGTLRGFWWYDKSSLVLARGPKGKDRQREKKGLPFTSLKRLPVGGPGEAREFLRLHMSVEDVACLPDGRLLLVALWSAVVDQALAGAKGDPDKAVALLQQEADYQVLTELPFWENGGGVTDRCRRRLYLWDGKALKALTDERTTVEGLRVSPGGGWATYLAKSYDTVAPIENRLMRLDTRTLKSADITCADEPFSHEACVPVTEDMLLVCGSNMREFGLNQNPVFYRVSLAAKTADPLDLSGRFDLGSSVCTDLSMAGAAEMTADENQVYWVSTVDEGSHLMAIDMDTGVIRQVTRQPGAVMELAREENGCVVVAMRGLAGAELYRVADDGDETRLTGFNTAATQGFELAQPAPLAYTTARGQEIRGFVMLPPGLAEGERCPAILDIHGGPKTVYGPVLFHEMQYWAGQGYAVMFCNPTGGDGRGDSFADLRGHYGEVDYTDIMGFVDAALAAYPAIDPQRLGVTGGSYGGFMTNWIISHTRRFAAAASQRGISNWLSMAGMSDIGYYFVPDQTGTGVWQNPATVWGQSPMKFADRVRTPTLFIHSEEDYRCPLAEGIQMYTALQMGGVDTRMCIFKGENHELSRSGKPSHRVRRMREITQWFDRYLKPGG